MGCEKIFVGLCLLWAILITGSIVIETAKSMVGLAIYDLTYFFASLGFTEDLKEVAWQNCKPGDESFWARGAPWKDFFYGRHFDAICAADLDYDQVCSLMKSGIVHIAKSATAASLGEDYNFFNDRPPSVLHSLGGGIHRKNRSRRGQESHGL